MRSVIPIWIAKLINILLSVCCCVFGIIIIAIPEISESVVGIVIGVLLILLGVFKVIGYFSKDLFRLAFQYDLQLGIVLVLLGIAVLVKPEQIFDFICVVFGISIFIDGLFKISIASDSKKFGIKSWLAILLVAVATSIYGALLVFFPSESVKVLTIHLGISLIWEGVLNLIVMLLTVKIVKHQKPDNPNDTEWV